MENNRKFIFKNFNNLIRLEVNLLIEYRIRFFFQRQKKFDEKDKISDDILTDLDSRMKSDPNVEIISSVVILRIISVQM